MNEESVFIALKIEDPGIRNLTIGCGWHINWKRTFFFALNTEMCPFCQPKTHKYPPGASTVPDTREPALQLENFRSQ